MSAAAHAMLLAALPSAQRSGGFPAVASSPSIEARLATVTPSSGHAPGPVEPAAEQPKGDQRALAAVRDTVPARASETGTPTLAQPVDLTWYGAHELDTYPRSLVPLRFDYPLAAEPGGPGARLLLWLRIDEQGHVIEVKAGEPGVPGELVDAARASLAAIRFMPARKDERAVKSRIQVSIGY